VKGQYKCEYLYGDRCDGKIGLQVHHRHYDTLHAERDEDLEVLCKFHHVVREVEKTECSICSEPTVDAEDALDIVQQAAELYGVKVPTLEMADAPDLCDYHDHTLSKE
jgi:hypothetical protein